MVKPIWILMMQEMTGGSDISRVANHPGFAWTIPESG